MSFDLKNIESQKKKTTKEIVEHIVADLIEGKSMSKAIESHKAFSEYEYYSIKIGATDEDAENRERWKDFVGAT